MLLATYNCFTIPFNEAYQPDIFESFGFQALDAFIDFLFMIDIVINFRISYINVKTGEEEFNLKKIAKNYLKGRFWIDLFASLPLDFISSFFVSNKNNVEILKIFGLLKLVRISRLGRIIILLNIEETIKISLKLANMIFMLLVYFHCQACLWYILVSQNKEWVPPLDYLVTREVYNDSLSMKYLTSYYYSVMFFANNDNLPVSTESQLTFCSFALLISAIMNANVLGNVAVLVSSLSRRTTAFQEKLDTVNTSMKNMKIPENKQDKIRNFIMRTHSTLEAQQEMNTFLNYISPTLRREVTKHIFSQMSCKSVLFQNRSDILEHFSR